jgi:hypothetical protein
MNVENIQISPGIVSKKGVTKLAARPLISSPEDVLKK